LDLALQTIQLENDVPVEEIGFENFIAFPFVYPEY
jgi:hypothetical protein